ncbi:hypothetical protein [Rhodoferax antarcticus]|uniref:hypothetical protein n=1 Tax=Rhodoferax antarcticus TaxID=81479 RepID=UPI002224E4B1|nr:hypothetical protein [Rhodoferax antarcticus]MCW2313516.1 low affinity Fe/Cu permease [Rhodoferax antarcticus]
MHNQQTVLHPDSATKIFVFEEVYPLRAAQEQADKKKLSAFGMFAKFNPLNRPKEETVQLSRQELRWEPFWHIVAKRSVDYSCQLAYQVPVHNPYAQTLQIDDKVFEVARQKDKARIEFVALEHCHRKIQFDQLIDGMQRDIKSSVFAQYISKYKYAEAAQVERPELLKPLVSMAAAKQMASANLTGQAVNAFEIQGDHIEFESTHMYMRPVFAFEFRWSSADKVGVIEVDGLTGEVVENGRWFKDKVNKILTREALVDLGAEVAGSLVPGGGVGVKLLGKMTDSRV